MIRRICCGSTFERISRRPHWLIDRALENLPGFQVQGHGIDIGPTLDASGWTKGRTSRNLLLNTFYAQQRRVNRVRFVKNSSDGFVRAFVMKVDAIWISLVKFVYRV